MLALVLGGCGGPDTGMNGSMPSTDKERCEMCGKDVPKGELVLYQDSKICAECRAKQN